MKRIFLLKNVLLVASLFLAASCGSDDPSSDADADTDVEVSEAKFTYVINGQTYTDSKYWRSSIGTSDDLYNGSQKVYWEMELCGAIDDAVDGNWLEFEIFSQKVGKGFEFTQDNFCVPFRLADGSSRKTYEFKKKSGSAKITAFSSRSATVVFKNFIMEADGASYNITVNGSIDLDVD